MRVTRAIWAATLAVAAFCSAAAESQASALPTAYRVIANPRNPTGNVDSKFLSDAFLKKITRWPNGELILPVDLNADSPVRRKFTEAILRRSVPAVRSYWQQLIFSGRDVPPPELDSDSVVVQYVLKHAGAVGYVAASADLTAVKLIAVK